MEVILDILGMIIAYLLGSINSAILVSRYFKTDDPRSTGSNNPGTTNILRIAGKKAAIITLLGDAIKGMVAIIIASRLLNVQGFELGLVGLAGLLGHIYPIFFRFKGGKGVAVALGIWLALNPALGVMSLATWIAIAIIWRYSSLAALITTAAVPFYAIVVAHPQYFLPLVAMTVILFYKHRDNIQRLRKGTEGKINFKKSSGAE